MADDNPADVFAFPDFSLSSKLLNPSPSQDNQFFNLHLAESENPREGPVSIKPANADVDGFFKIPDLLTPADHNGAAGINGTGHENTPIPEPLHDVDLPDLDIFDDPWLEKDESPAVNAEYKAWDAFLMPDIPQATPLFITEAGPEVYDAAITQTEDSLRIEDTNSNVVQSNPFLAALLALAFGRGSVFFVWDEEKACFIPDLDKMRISGYSTEVLHGIQRLCLECGTTTRSLSAYVQATFNTHPSAVKVALARAIDVILLAVQINLGERARRVRSLLQLQALIQPIQVVLAYFKSLITRMSRSKTDEQMLSIIFEEAQTLEHGNALLSEVMREVLSQVTRPWATFVEKWIGTKAEEGIPLTKENPGNSFVKVENIAVMDDFGFETEEPDYVLDEDRMPKFVPSEVASTMFETGKTLRLLRSHHPEHPLCELDLVVSSQPPILQWQFDWGAIGHFQKEVDNYEQRLSTNIKNRMAIQKSAPQTTHLNTENFDEIHCLQFFGQEEAQLERRLLESIRALNQPPTTTGKEANLSKLLHARLFEAKSFDVEQTISNFSPHWSLVPLHSFSPLVTAQARVINREYMKLLFNSHNLHGHLFLQKQFHLLGNGVFCSRLSHALFDPDLDTAERQAGIALNGGTMGLRLSGRDNWPPASSELRLALMGVLTESYLPSSPSETTHPITESQDLLGDISFAVRDLSDEEIDKCLDPSSLEALDFLRLSYKPPAPLSPVFPPVVLAKYDKIFKLLLRVLRMLYVTEQLFRDISTMAKRWQSIDNVALRFRFEAQHFVASISTYFLDTGIELPWRRFETWLEGIQAGLTEEASEHKEQRVISPDELREEHERTLDHMMHLLLLRKRQQAVLKLLEEIFTLILKFSKIARLQTSSKVDQKTSCRGLYDAFKKKFDVFITVCRGMSEKGGYGGKVVKNDLTIDDGRRGEGVKEENIIDRFLIKLEMSGYYAPART
ncbi:Spc97/Spc98 family protein [Xylariaceae sp. FL0662B]|nr:Spc97/Spc98 family protein [Xylariaceae sp. FL0662B]